MARDFAGGYLDLGSATALELTSGWTVSFWIKTTSSTLAVIMGFYDPSSPFTGWGIGFSIITAGKLQAWSSTRGTWREPAGMPAINDGNWHHIVADILSDGTGWGIYVDGTGYGDATDGRAGAPGGTNKCIGADGAGATNFTGQLAEIAVWSSEGAQGISQLPYFSPRLFTPDTLVAYWPLHGRASPETDYWRNGLSGTVSGTVNAADHQRIYYPATPTTFAVPDAAVTTTRGIPFGTRGTAFNGGRTLTGIIR